MTWARLIENVQAQQNRAVCGFQNLHLIEKSVKFENLSLYLANSEASIQLVMVKLMPEINV